MAPLKKLLPYIYNLFLVIIVWAIIQLPYFEELNLIFVDQLQGNLKPHNDIVIIGIDDASLKKIGAWPWNRGIFAQAFNNLNNTKPKAVGIDVLFLEGRDGDEKLHETLKDLNYPLIFGSKIISNEILNSIFTKNVEMAGFVDLPTDSDGKIRRINPFHKVGKICMRSFSYAIYNQADKHEQNEKNSTCELPEYLNKFTENSYLYFNSTSDKFVQYSFADLYNNKIDSKKLIGKIILIGSTAKDLRSNLNDNFVDIFGVTRSGVEIHANIVNSFFSNKFQKNINNWVFLSIMLVIGTVLMFFYKKFRRNRWEILILIFGIVILNVIGIILFEFGTNWNFVGSNLITLLGYVLNVLYKYITESKEKRFIQKAFGQYISPSLLAKLVEHPESLKLGGEKRIMTVMFTDIRGFTTVSEKMGAEELTSLLNDYLDQMSNVILKNDGTIDKFIGDAIMAFWNAPLEDKDHQIKAIKTAIEMTERLEEFNKKYPQYDDFKIGIGIHTGDMVVGNVGSTKRFDYTVLGDNVNLGSRIEGLTKKYKTSVLLTDNVLKENNTIIFKLIDEVIVKGKTKSIKIYEPLKSTNENLRKKERYESAFARYANGDFEKALELFAVLKDDKTALCMIERIENLKDIKMDDWHGIWKWEEK